MNRFFSAFQRVAWAALVVLIAYSLALTTSWPQDVAAEGAVTVEFEDDNGLVVEGTHIRVPVDARGILRLRYRVGPGGIPTGGVIEVLRDSMQALPLSVLPETASDDVAVRCSRAASRVRLERPAEGLKHPRALRLRVEEEALREGDEIEIEIGAGDDEYPALVTDAGAARGRKICLRVDRDGNGAFEHLNRPVLLDLIAAPAERIEIVAPSIVEEGQRFEVVFRAEDANSNVDFGFREGLNIWVERAEGEQVWRVPAEESISLPREISFEIGGVVRVPGVARSSGVFWIAAKDTEDHRGLSNPIRVVSEAGHRLWWGDLYARSSDSDGVGTPEDNFRFARDVAAIDFVALTDRLELDTRGLRLDAHHRGAMQAGLIPTRNVFQWWLERQASADSFDTDGRFVTLPAFQWSAAELAGGDRCVYLTDSTPLPVATRLDDLYRLLSDRDRIDNVLVVPVVERTKVNLDYHRPGLESALCIYSSKGAFEWLAQEALGRGLHFAFLAGSGSRHGCPGRTIWQRRADSKLWPYEMELRGGLTAVLAPALDRGSIVRAIRQRRCYATSGARMLVEFEVDGRPMGEMLNVDRKPTIRLEVHGAGPLSRVDVIRDRFRLTTLRPRGRSLSASFEDKSVLPGRHYYYARVHQADGEIAWTSPIWLTVNAGTDFGRAVEAASREAELPAWDNDDAELERDPNSAESEAFDVKSFSEDTRWLEKLLTSRDGQPEWSAIEPVARVKSRDGEVLSFHARRDGKRVSIRLWREFTTRRIHISPGRGP